eukprot:gene15147-biopygen1888
MNNCHTPFVEDPLGESAVHCLDHSRDRHVDSWQSPSNHPTVVDRFGMPPPEQLFHKLSQAKFLAKIDLRSGFWELRLSEESQHHVAFWKSVAPAGIEPATSGLQSQCSTIELRNLYTYTRLPFGHVNATARFQHVIETELQAAGITKDAVFVDDVVFWGDTFEEHLDQRDRVFKRFIQVGLRAHPAKTVVAA